MFNSNYFNVFNKYMTSDSTFFSLEEVINKNYIIIDNNVYDFQEFEEKHPGGAKVLVYFRGKNATEKFYKIAQHNEEVKNSLVHFKVGEFKTECSSSQKEWCSSPKSIL